MAQGTDNGGVEQGRQEEAARPAAPSPRAFRPLLLGLGLMLAGLTGAWEKSTALGSALVGAYAQGTLVIAGLVGWAVCALILYAVGARRGANRLPLAPVMGCATVLTAACPVLAVAFLETGGVLQGAVDMPSLLLLLLGGLCGGAGLALTFSGWHTCVQGASWFYGAVYLALSLALCVVVLMWARTLDLYVCAAVCAVLAVAGAALLHLQVRVLDRPARP